MRFKIKKIFAVYLVLAAVCYVITPAAVAYRHVTVDASGVAAASSKVDIKRIDVLGKEFQQHKYSGMFSSALHYMNFNFIQSKANAESCFNEKDDGSVDYITAHLICGEMISRVYYMNAEYAKWASLMLFYEKNIVPEFWRRVPKTKGIPIGIMTMVKYASFVDWPSVHIDPIPHASHAVSIEWERMDGFKGDVSERSPVMRIKINGISVEAMIDTGSSMTVIPSYMARNLGVRHVFISDGGAKTAYSEHMHVGLARVDTIDMAGFRFHNPMVSVADVPRPIIGLVQLMKLHRILISKNIFRVIDGSGNGISCAKRMYFGGYLTGPPSMIKITAVVDGHIKHPVLDTGLAGTFRKNVHHMRNGLGGDFWSHGAVGNKKLVGYWTYETINMNGLDNRMRGSVVLYKKRQVGYRFGAQLIKKIGPLYLDFDSGHACFLKE